MKALSIQQPWVMAICHGKDVENRCWSTRYRGTLAIHASKKFQDPPGLGLNLIRDLTDLTAEQAIAENHLGAVVAVADLVGCHNGDPWDMSHPCGTYKGDVYGPSRRCSPWAAHGAWHWELANVRQLPEPVPARGSLGLWTLPDDVAAAVQAQLAPLTRKADA